jgi:hypothetical protein
MIAGEKQVKKYAFAGRIQLTFDPVLGEYSLLILFQLL